MNAPFPILAIALLSALAPPCLADEPPWRLAVENTGIRVYLGSVPGSKYQRFRGVTEMQASVSTLSDLQENLRVACAWLYACQSMRLLKNEGDHTWVYLTTELPWPAKSRDMVLHVHTQRTADGGLVRHLEAVPGWVPESAERIRVEQLQGEWAMQPMGDGRTEVTYQLQADPAGEIPAWLANRFVVDAPLQTLQILRAVAERQGVRPAAER